MTEAGFVPFVGRHVVTIGICGGLLVGASVSGLAVAASVGPAPLRLGSASSKVLGEALRPTTDLQLAPTTYVADPGLSGATQATVYRLEAPTDRVAVAQDLAQSLGLTGTLNWAGLPPQPASSDSTTTTVAPTTHPATWSFSIDATSGASLSVGGDAQQSWYYNAAPTTGTTTGVDCTQVADPSQSTPTPDCTTTTTAPSTDPSPISDAQAISLATPILEAGGAPSDATPTVTVSDASQGLVTVTDTETLSGLTSDRIWSVTVAPDGSIAQASGSLAVATAVDTYPVIAAADAVSRLSDPAWEALSGGFAEPMLSAPVTTTAPTTTDGTAGTDVPTTSVDPTSTTTDPSAGAAPGDPGSGADVTTTTEPTTSPVPPTVVHLTEATLTLSTVTDGDGQGYLVPTWNYQASDGGTVSAVGLDAADVVLPNPSASGPIVY